MATKNYQKHKEKLQKEACKNIKIFLKKKKIKDEKRSENDIKIFLKPQYYHERNKDLSESKSKLTI